MWVLDLKGNPIGDRGAARLAAALSPPLSQGAQSALAAHLRSRLHSDAGTSGWLGPGVRGAAARAAAGGQEPWRDTGLHLNLSSCGVGPEGALALAQAMFCDSLLHWVQQRGGEGDGEGALLFSEAAGPLAPYARWHYLHRQ